MAKKIINIRQEEELWQKAKSDAALKGMTLQDWLEMAIKHELKDWESRR